MRSEIKFLAFLTIILTAIIIIPIASAENVNVTPVTTPFITIDPIGNHIIGDVFFINGTTNLPVSENLTLGMVALSYIMRPHQKTETGPGPHRSANLPNLPISPALPGLNRWSANVTDSVKELVSGEYLVQVIPQIKSCNTTGCLIPDEASQIFTVFPANNSIKSNILQTTFQSPSPILPAISATSPTPTISQTASSTQLTPTNATSLSLILSVTALMGIVVLRLFNRKKRE